MSQQTTAPTVHVGKAWRLILSDLGLSHEVVLRKAGLPIGLLDGEGTRITLDDFYRLWDTVDQTADDPELALKLGQVASIELFDPAFFAAMCSPDMNTAAVRLGHFKRLVGAFRLDVQIGAEETAIRFRCKHRPDVPDLMGLSELVFLVNFVRRATREAIVPAQVIFPNRPRRADVYEAWFGQTFTQGDGLSVVLKAQDARQPFLTHDDQMWEFFEPSLRRRMEDARAAESIRHRVEHALVELLPSGRSQIEDVARELAVSKRSLQRRLSQEGTSWMQVLNDVRERLARHYLASTGLSVAEVSFLLGFEDPNSLFRAFHRWTGTTPEAWRADINV